RTEDWKILKDVPVKIKLLLPNGKEFQAYKKTLDAEGSFEASFYLPNAVMSGLFTLEVYTANDVLLQSKRISVEEFVPDRIKVTVSLDKEEVKPGDKLKVNVAAVNFFGPAA